jgi:hypothetical protein
MKLKISILLVCIVMIASVPLSAQSFKDIQAGLTGVAECSANWMDTDRDGDPDVIVSGEFFNGNNPGIKQIMFKNQRQDKFGSAAAGLPDFYRGDWSMGDYNLDGIQDVAVMGEKRDNSRIATIYKGLGNGSFAPTGIQFTPMRDGSIRFGDVDADGDLDILLAGESMQGAQTLVYLNERSNKFSPSRFKLPGIQRGEAVWIDFDVDGKQDIFMIGANRNGAPISALFHNTDSSFNVVNTQIAALKNSSVAIGDVDSDGDNDLLVMGETGSGKSYTRLYRNERNGVFRIVSTSFVGVRSGFADWSDMDHDGDLDLLISGESNNGAVSKVYRNDRGRGFTDLQAGIIPLYTSDGQWGDYDLDGDQDVLIAGISTDYKHYARIYRNDPAAIVDSTQYEEESTDIWNNQTVVEERSDPIYYYVYSSSYGDPKKTGTKEYFVFISPVKKPKVQYEMEEKFDLLFRKAYPNWAKIDQGNITSAGFHTKQEADQSRAKMIDEYTRRGFKLIEINW